MIKRIAMACLLTGITGSISFAAAPVPEAARGVSIPQDKGYYVEEISNGLYWFTDGSYTTMFLTTGQGVIVVDAPPGFGDKLLRAVDEVTDESITHVIYSHSHADHIGGAANYPAGVIVIAHEATKAHLEAEPRPRPFGVFVGGGSVPLPTVTFADSYTLTVGNQTLELAYRGLGP